MTGLSSLNGADASENDTRRLVKISGRDTGIEFRVHVTDDVIRVWIDDKETIAVNHKDQQVKTRIEMRSQRAAGLRQPIDRRGSVRAIEVRQAEAGRGQGREQQGAR